MSQAVKIHGALLVKNTTFNFVGQLIPALVAIVTIPYIIHGLGIERFGILSLVWVVQGYFSLFDLGLGRATTKFSAEVLGRNEAEKIPSIVWTSVALQIVFGVIGGVTLAGATPFLVERVFNVPLDLTDETRMTLYLTGISLFPILCTGSFRGLMEAAQRFDLINMVRTISGSMAFLLPAIAVYLGYHLPGVVAVLILSTIATGIVYLWLCLRLFPMLKRGFAFHPAVMSPLFSFGGWVTLSGVIIPVLVYLDRFMIAAIVSVAALGYYTAPYEVVSRLQIFPSSLATTLFPAFSTIAADRKKDLERLYARSLKYLLLIMGPMMLISVLFAEDILRLWLGADFALKSTLIFRILAVGVFLNALAQMPANLLDGVGRPDLRAKILFSYSLLYVAFLWFFIVKLGMVGAALAWTLRAVMELGLFFIATWRLLKFTPTVFIENGLLRGVVGLLLFVLLSSAAFFAFGGILVAQSIMAGICLILFASYTWKYIFDSSEQQLLLSTLVRMKR
jgi:O-antigen/teichoic acid export membrane protein